MSSDDDSTPSGPAVPPRKGSGRKPSNAPFSAGAAKGSRPAPKGQQASFRARKRRQQQLVGGGIIGAVIVVIVVLVAVGLGSSAKTGPTDVVTAAQLDSVTAISPDAMASAYAGQKVGNPPTATGGSPLVGADGKPEVLYMGAEYCPYCAGERWSLVMALSQFGTFTNLHSIVSSSTDTVASIPTYTFVGSSYSSPYIDFQSVEEQTVTGAPLQTPTAAQTALLQKYDDPPYTQSQEGIPFIDIGGYAVQDGLGFSLAADQALQHQKFADVAQAVGNQSTGYAGQITSEAGALVADICKIDGGKSIDGNAACKAFPTPVTQPPSGS